MTQNGFIDTVAIIQAGSAIAVAANIGDTTLYIDDAYDFDETGGFAEISGLAFAYSSSDHDLDTLTVTDALTAALGVGTPVLVSPNSFEKRASVTMSDSGDTIDARVPHNLYDRIPEGIRDEAQESVTIELVSNEWVIVDIFGQEPSIDGSYIDPATVPSPATDGQPPASSPLPVAIGTIGVIIVRWSAIENHDPVMYTLHMSTTQAFTPDSTTVLNVTPGLTTAVRSLPNNTALAYGTDYYFRVVASDDDGDAAPSAYVSAQIMQVTGPDVAANYVYANQVIADQITGGTLSADVTLSSTIKTADTGARVEMSPSGLLITDSTGAPTTSLGTDSENFFKGNIEANGLTVNGGATFRSTTNELSRAAVWTLAAGITASTNAPTVVNDWEKVQLLDGVGGHPWASPGNLRGLSRTPDGKWISADAVLGGFHKWNSDGTYNSFTSGITGLTHVTQPVSGGSYYGMQINGATASISRLTEENVFTDDFSGTLAGWPSSSVTGSGTKSIVSGKVQLVAPTGADGATIKRTLETNFRTRAVQMQVAVTSGTPIGNGVLMSVESVTEGTNFTFRIDGSALRMEWTLNGSWDYLDLTYNATTHAWWKIYEMNGRINFQTSPDGVTWTTQANPAHGRPASVFSGMYWSYSATGGSVGSNLISNPGFETNTAGWTPVSPATLTRTSNVLITTPDGSNYSVNLAKPSASNNTEMSYQSIAVVAGHAYKASGYAEGNKATNLTSYIKHEWHDSTGALISTTTSGSTAINDSGFTYVQATATAPAGATSVVLRFGTNDASTSSWNANTYWDAMFLGDATVASVTATGDNARYYGIVGSLPIARINTTQSPALGSYVTTGDLLFAEYDASNTRYSVKRISHEDMSTVATTFTSASNAAFGGPLAGVMRANFDFAEERYIFSAQGSTGTNWWSFKNSDGSYQSVDNFPVINGGHQGMSYDGTNFWALGSDGNLYKHTNIKWVNGTDSAAWGIGFTWYDGGTQETTLSPLTNITMKMRSRLTVTSSAIPYTAVGDPDRIRIYVNRGGGTKYRQTTTAANINTATLTTIAFSGTAAPTTNTFASATPAKIRNTDDSLIISADGSGTFGSLFIGSNEVLANPLYYHGYLSSGVAVTGGGNTNITTWVADGSPNSTGITISSGTVTVPRAGRYRITCQLWWPAIASPTGVRTIQAISVSTTLASHTVVPNASVATPSLLVKTVRLTASQTFFIRGTSGQTITIAGTTPDISYLNVEYVGP